jgi:hypothetical protein
MIPEDHAGGVYLRISRDYLAGGIFLQTMTMCPVFESIFVVAGRHRQETVFAFSSLVVTQCSISCAFAGGVWLRTTTGAGGGGGGVGAAALFFSAQPVNSRRETSQNLFIAE